ncbi:hypothetical protein ACCO45_010075 [Purpureocillium lilacinum]|uniref:Uncharacterized protein n=1 Tax=Purpureocillium lilacinum TaxID=33203 RepID=A0ACC4DFB6_PURLI
MSLAELASIYPTNGAQYEWTAALASPKYQRPTGWNDGTAWLLGLLQGGLSFTAFDAVAHLVEEMPHPRRDCPRTMVLSIVLGLITTLMKSLAALLGELPTHNLVRPGADNPPDPEVVTSSSRLTAAFARQGGVPFSSTFAHVNKRLDLPLNSMLLTNSMVIIFGLIYLGASSAFNAIVSSCVVGLNISYLIPILVLMARGRAILPRGEFSLGRWGYPVNITACLFLTFT